MDKQEELVCANLCIRSELMLVGAWKGVEIDEGDTLERGGLEGFTENISVSFAEREEHNPTK